jgi:hypothetical protein
VFVTKHFCFIITGATSVLDQTAARLYDYKSTLGAIAVGQKQENEVRELHQWAITTLKKIQHVRLVDNRFRILFTNKRSLLRPIFHCSIISTDADD